MTYAYQTLDDIPLVNEKGTETIGRLPKGSVFKVGAIEGAMYRIGHERFLCAFDIKYNCAALNRDEYFQILVE